MKIKLLTPIGNFIDLKVGHSNNSYENLTKKFTIQGYINCLKVTLNAAIFYAVKHGGRKKDRKIFVKVLVNCDPNFYNHLLDEKKFFLFV